MSVPREARQLIREGVRRLAVAGKEHARHEAEWLLSHLVGSRALDLYARDAQIPEQTAEHFFAKIDARTGGMPLQYLIGEAEFCGAAFVVGPGVFIPRPETESIVEAALLALRPRAAQLARPLRLLDVGTGSGCIAVSLARRLPACVVVGVEVSWEALCTAHVNVRRHGVADRVYLVQGRWSEAVRSCVDAIVSNPPYIPSAQVDHLPQDVRHEPRLSLDGGEDGMRDLIQVMRDAQRVLVPGGLLVMECGEDQVEPLVRRARDSAWVASATPVQDVATRPRGVVIWRTA